ncbi:hypothetical protein HOLleu_01816 [Holothuria leucospilota]|uniref:Sulfotransferase n=1 Tax=Holothuria leucospilota TaxID=206669 RepID=A0A9Q1CQG1_HOLLE|nr:hypothetical protein HOLleu_01816 [Holothuria leucospilota]
MSGHYVASGSGSWSFQGIFACLVAILTVVVYSTYFGYSSNRTSVNVRLMKPNFAKTSSHRSVERKTTKVPATPPQNECNIVHEKLNSCNKLPNFFLYEDQRHHFQNAIINFWHLQKASGSTVASCLVDLYKRLGLPLTAHGGSSCRKKEEMLGYANYFNSSNGQPVVRGHDTLGLCDFFKEKITDRKCSVFTVFRDPYDRLVSHYFFNRQVARQTSSGDQLALILNKTIKEWIRKSGSPVWRAFSNKWKFERKDNGKEICTELQRPGAMTIEERWPPIDEHLTDTVNNLDKHLSFIGLTEDLQTTFQMLEEVYGLPFVEVCSDMHVLQGTYEDTNATEQRALKMSAKREIMEDPEIQHLMQFEVLVYEKAKEIFEAQKKVILKMKRARRKMRNLS